MTPRRLRILLPFVLVGCSKPQTDSNNPAPTASVQSVATTTTTTTTTTPTAPSASAGAAGAKAAGPPREGCDGVFDPPQGAIKLCDEHVLADKDEIHWTSWAVTTSRMDTFEPYRKHAGECKMGFTFKPPILSVSHEDMRLSIHDVKETGFPSCAKKPGAEAQSVIVISQKHTR